MDLKTFIAETLNQIAEGVETARANAGQSSSKIGVAPAIDNLFRTDGVVIGYSSDGACVQLVTFDVAVMVDETTSGEAGIKVWGVGGKAEGSKSRATESRVSFQVPITFHK